MQTCLECIPCLVRGGLEVIKMTIPEGRRQEAALREVLEAVSIAHYHLSPPYVAQEVYRIVANWSGEGDPYAGHKRQFNAIALKMLRDLEAVVAQSSDPFETAARIAIAGNIIDPSTVEGLDASRLRLTIQNALIQPLAVNDLGALRRAAARAQSILYLADNAGEIAFDRLLLNRLPLERVTFVVRGGPVLNDATLEDAEACGLAGMVRVIDNGSDVPGTMLSVCSGALREAFAAAELVIAKGQGNFETLSDEPHPGLFFMLKAKCPVVARQLGVQLGDSVVMKQGA